ncbi:hypothetical protein SEMRO_569_G168390.1 [Seminavis robusta]|uniref:Uncharacterized protein n=1 Tax=Seminavis robusta TaxID=568900 RepID=A0A9N8E353_9STRA|nr:hypothetical protein SEMRO_569_G168390.1 [Seminavis robusta]|eukprot:Sro569_g168390.1 n/a (751) ;mRNA; f:45872-48248
MNSLWSSPNDNEEEEEITVPDPNSIPADSGMVDAAGTAFDPFRSQMLLSTRTSLAAPDGPVYPVDLLAEAGAMEGGDKENDDDDPDDDPKNKNDDDDDAWSESPSNFDFSISSMDIERGIRNNAMQYVAFEAMYSAAYDMVYGACTWPRLLLSYCLGMFGFLRKKNNDADGPLPPEDNNHVQDMAVAASQSAAIGIGAGVMASQSAAAGAGASSMTAAVSALSTPTKIGIIVAAAITVAATTAGIAAGISSGSDNTFGPCAGSIEATDVKQGVMQIVFSSSYTSSTVATPATGELLLENKEELEDTFAQVYNNITANSTNGALIDQCDIPRIPPGGVQLMQVESSEEDNFTNTFWVADVQCSGCSDTDPLFGTNTEPSPQLDPGTAVDDFVDQFTQAIQPILTTKDQTQETDPMTSPPQSEQEDAPIDVLLVALVDPSTGERLPEQPQQLGPGDMIELIPRLDTVWNENTSDSELDRLVPGSPSSTVASAPTATSNTGPPTARDANLPTKTTSTESNATVAAPTNAGSTEASSNNELPNVPSAVGSPSGVSNQGGTGPSAVSGPTSSVATNHIATKNPSGNAGTFAPAATSPSFSMANKDQANGNQQQEQGPSYGPNSIAPPTASINPMLPSIVKPASTPANGNAAPSVAQSMAPSNVDQTNTPPEASVPAIPNPPAILPTAGAVPQAPSPAGIASAPSSSGDPVSPSADMSANSPSLGALSNLAPPTKVTSTVVPTREMLSPETCAGQP